MYIQHITIFLLASLGSYILVKSIKDLSLKYNILALPKSDRWHDKAIPLHGSFGFFVVFIFLTLFTISAYSPDKELIIGSQENLISPEIIKQITFVIALIGSSLLFFIFGFVDDLYSLKPATRLLFQVLVSSLFIFDTNMYNISDIQVINFLYTLVWFVGIINAINFIDSFDGIASGNVLISTICILLLALSSEESSNLFYMISILVIFSGVLIGYLIHNFPSASIFMGDSGSLTIGFIIAAVSIPSEFNTYLGLSSTDYLSLVIYPCLILAFPIFDTTLVVVSRILNGRKFYEGGKDHTAHRLSKIGLSDKSVFAVIMTYTIFSCSLIFISKYFDYSLILISLAIFSISLVLLFLFHNSSDQKKRI